MHMEKRLLPFREGVDVSITKIESNLGHTVLISIYLQFHFVDISIIHDTTYTIKTHFKSYIVKLSILV